MMNRKLVVLLLVASASAIQIPIVQGQYRCMLVYSMGNDETVKIEMEMPMVNGWAKDDYYYLTLRNTKSNEVQHEKLSYGHFRREISVHEKIIYELCFQFMSPREVKDEILVEYNADTHYTINKDQIKVPDNLLKVEHMRETYQNAIALQQIAANYIKLQKQRAEKEQLDFQATVKAEGRITLVSLVEMLLIAGFGVYQFFVLKNKLQQAQYQIC